MVEEKQKYDFKEIITNLSNFLEDENLNLDSVEKLKIIIYKLQNINVIIENIDEDLVLQNIQNDFSNCSVYSNDVLNGNLSYIDNLSSSVDNILKNIISCINYSVMFNNKTNLKQYIKNFKVEITKQSNNLENEYNDILETIKNKKENIENQDSELNHSIEDLKKELDNIKTLQEEININSSNIIEKCETNVNQFLEKEKKEINELCDLRKQELTTNFDNLSKDYSSQFETLLEEIKEKDAKISKLIGIVGEKARIGEYKKNANASRLERIIWQILTVILFIISFIIMCYVTLTTKDYNKFTIFKYIVSVILMGASTYTGKQASNSRKDEVYYRKQELELASIDVYLESMEPATREEIKKTLSTKIFGQAQNTYTSKYDDKKGISVEDIVKIIDSIKNKG